MQWFDDGRLTSDLWPRRAWLATAAGLCLSATALGEDAKDPPKDPADKEKPKGPPDPEDVTFESKDHVILKATYWEPEEPGKETIPIILIHGWLGNRQEFDLLGKHLQSLGHAVISLDLRGHGGSTILRRPSEDKDIEIKPEKLTKPALDAMIYDVQAAKEFLFAKHVEGKLNLNQLCVVGSDIGAIVALNFADHDWRRPIYPSKIYKNGQDVQALVLLSPESSFKGMTTKPAMTNPQVVGRVSTLIVVGGNESKPAGKAKKLNDVLAGKHVKVNDDEAAEKKDLFFKSLSTELQGTKLLVRGLGVDKLIEDFIKLRLVNKADDYPWSEREKPR